MPTFTSNTPLTIGDYTVTTSNLAVSGISSISDLNVALNISHTWNSDLRVFVISPTGKQVELFSEVGIGGKGFVNTTLDDEASTSVNSGSGTFSGTYKPEGRLADFDGLNANGTWKLKIIDAAQGDTGKLNSWSIIVNGSSGGGITPPPPPTGDLTKYGTSGNDTLTGGSGGKFTLIGGAGNDTYIVDADDVITEISGGGTDTIQTSVSYVMSENHVNNLTLTGSSAINGTGNIYKNVITGNAANNILVGGDNTDTLIGGGGADRFRFNAKNTGIDLIEDFSISGGDRIEVSKVGFGASSVSQFSYNSSTGDLSFNSTVFAELDTGLAFQPTQHLVLI